MNHIFRVVFNHVCQTYQAVAEIAKGQSKSETTKSASSSSICKKSSSTLKSALRPLSALIALVPLAVHAAPTGGHISAGDASISQHGKITNIQQNSQRAAINWQTFGIKADETVNFKQPNAQAVILNRVIGNEKSVIDGAMNANGKVFISNPNGMIFGKNAQINVGALVATTAKIKDQDFMNGLFKFDQATGNITQLGDIKVPTGGVVALIAPIVENKGKITAPQGKVLLASAEQFSITLPDNGQFAYTLDRGTLQGLVDNGGAILADGGHVILTAKGTDAVKKSLIKHTGKIEANTVQNKNGVIELLGDLDNSRLEVSGSLKAEAKENGDGGFIETSAADVKIQETAQISTKAENGKDGKYLLDPNDLIIGENGVMTGSQVGDMLANNGDFELKSTNGKAEGKGDVIINDEINWNQGKLTLNAQNDIHINKTLNGTGTAQLALEYGQGTADGGQSDYYIEKDTPLKDRTVKVNLPEGQNFSIKKGNKSRVVQFNVIHNMPEIVKNSEDEWESKFSTDKVAFGKDIDISYTKNYSGFTGWKIKQWQERVHGLGHVVDNLYIQNKKDDQLVGLFDQIGNYNYSGTSGEIRDLAVTNANINSIGYNNKIGILAGSGQNISNTWTTGVITAHGDKSNIGGLVGVGEKINNSYSKINIDFSNTDDRNKYGENNLGRLLGEGQYIDNSHAEGDIVFSESDKKQYNGSIGGDNIFNIGGIVGKGKKIVNSYAIGNIEQNKVRSPKSYENNKSLYIGGLIGDGGEIESSYAVNDIKTQRDFAIIGGLIGKNGQLNNDDSIANSYVEGNIISTGDQSLVGGLIGTTTLISGSVINSYANNKLSSPRGYTGGLFGNILGTTPNKTVKNSFYNVSKNNLIPLTAGVNSTDDQPISNVMKVDNASGKSDEELKQRETFTDWDFNHVWRIQESVDYPRLRPLTKADVVVGGISTQPGHVLNMDIQAHHLNKTYDGQAVTSEDDLLAIAKQNGHDDIITVKGLVGGDQLSDLEGKLVYGGTWQNAQNAGSYTIEPSGLSGGQKYAVTYQNGSLTIDPKTIAIFGQKYYDGSTKVDGKNNTKLNFVGRVNNDPIELLGEGVLTDKNASASDSDLDLKHLRSHNFSLSNPNYVLDSNQDKHRWSVSKKPINLIVNGEKVHDGNRIAVLNQDTQKVTNDILASDTSHVDFTGEVTLSGSESGTHTIESHNVVLTGEEAKNYTIEKVEGSWKIKDVPVTTPPTTTPPVTTPPTTTPPVTTPPTTTPPVTTPTTTTSPVVVNTPITPMIPTPIQPTDTGKLKLDLAKPNTQQQDSTSTKPLPEYRPDLQNEIGNVNRIIKTVKQDKEFRYIYSDRKVFGIPLSSNGFHLGERMETHFADGSIEYEFPIFNKKSASLEIQVLDKYGNLIETHFAEPNYQNTSITDDIVDKFTGAFKGGLSKDIEHQWHTKKTDIKVKVPKGGSLKFTYNSYNAKLYNFVSPVSDMMNKFLSSLGNDVSELPASKKQFLMFFIKDFLEEYNKRIVNNGLKGKQGLKDVLNSLIDTLAVYGQPDKQFDLSVKFSDFMLLVPTNLDKGQMQIIFKEFQDSFRTEGYKLMDMKNVWWSLAEYGAIGLNFNTALSQFNLDLSRHDFTLENPN